jgi:hypothetical protein
MLPRRGARLCSNARGVLQRYAAHTSLIRSPLARTKTTASDDALAAVLQDIKSKIENSSAPQGSEGAEITDIPGVKTGGPKLVLQFTCTYEHSDLPADDPGRTYMKVISRKSYEHGP